MWLDMLIWMMMVLGSHKMKWFDIYKIGAMMRLVC